jgi:hypothetical protein
MRSKLSIKAILALAFPGTSLPAPARKVTRTPDDATRIERAEQKRERRNKRRMK